MKAEFLTLIAGLVLLPGIVVAAPHTPQPGSAERKAICDALREYVIQHVATRKMPQPIVFKVDTLRIDQGFAWFEGIPLFKDGSYATDYLPDMAYVMVLQHTSSGWRVLHDLSRSDVPDESEAVQLRKELQGVPDSIIPDFWRRILKRGT